MKLIVDTFSEIHSFLKPYLDDEFWDLKQHTIVPGATYVIGRQQCIDNRKELAELVANNVIRLVISNPHEGSETLMNQIKFWDLEELGRQRRFKVVSGGEMHPDYDSLCYDKFLSEILDYEENIAASQHIDDIYSKTDKPWNFLFLNGRYRAHRKYAIEKFDSLGLLDRALWSNLDSMPDYRETYQLWINGVNVCNTARAPRTLPPEYEVPRYSANANPASRNRYVKFDLFGNDWGEIYLHPAPYVDTYFSVISETVCDTPHSFRTEKTWKPIVMGHPWIAVANRGFYRDMHNLGFQTYGHVIDESFDSIDNNQDRLNRIAEIVADLCRQDLAAFLKECYNVSKYNQQHHRELAVSTRQELPDRLLRFFNE